eukprot:scaffold28856_cov58-Phaeocystis_antarctica.AAC.3
MAGSVLLLLRRLAGSVRLLLASSRQPPLSSWLAAPSHAGAFAWAQTFSRPQTCSRQGGPASLSRSAHWVQRSRKSCPSCEAFEL